MEMPKPHRIDFVPDVSVLILDERFILGRKSMKTLLWLSAVIGTLLMLSCGCSEKRASTKDQIGDEEYRVMSAVLKAEKMRRNEGIRDLLSKHDRFGNLIETTEAHARRLAKIDSLMRYAGHTVWHDKDSSFRSLHFYDSLVQRYGMTAYYVVRNPQKCGPLYDSLSDKYGDLSYYVTVYCNTLRTKRADSPAFLDEEASCKLTPELVRSFDSINLVSYELSRERFGDSLVVDLISSGDVDSTLWGRFWWSAFYDKFLLSDGTISVSRVGFNSDSTVAVVRVKSMSGPVSGAEWFSLLEKRINVWTVVAEQVNLVN
jgi:hypothetical protein